MADARINKTLQAAASAGSRSTGTEPPPGAEPRTSEKHAAVAATLDELMAGEARASLKRAREAARDETAKYKPRPPVPPARIIVRPAQANAWKPPFVSLAIVVGISTFVSASAFAYLFMRPMTTSMNSEAEIRSLRESVALLRQNVAELSTNVAINRTTLDAATKATPERTGRIASTVDRVEQNPPTATMAPARVAEEAIPTVRSAAAASTADVTGTIQQPQRTTSTSRDVITGWHIRRAYDGTALLENKSGVIEVTLGQDVPNIGRIQEIKYENNRWQVVTSKGVILPNR
jgi:hypothetical protein